MRPSVHYDEYDMNDFYVCAGAAPASSSGFQWDGWYVFVGIAVIVMVLLVLGWCIMKQRRTEKVDLGEYLAAENEYGSAAGVSADATNGK